MSLWNKAKEAGIFVTQKQYEDSQKGILIAGSIDKTLSTKKSVLTTKKNKNVSTGALILG